MATQIAFSDLNDWLAAQAENIPQTAYELEITDLTVSDIGDSVNDGTLGNILLNNDTKYVDLSATEIPSGVEDMTFCFFDCVTLVKSPVLPDTVTVMENCFQYCSLVDAPVLPSAVESLSYCFYGCENLVIPPVIPSTVTTMYACFYGCKAMIQAPEIPSGVTNWSGLFENCISLTIPPEIPSGVTAINDAFSGCTSLTQVPEIPSTVIDMRYTFSECYNISYVPIIPSSVIAMKECFKNCINLVKINRFEVPLSAMKTNYFQNAFQGCSSLTTIGYIPEESQDWHIVRLWLGVNIGLGSSVFAGKIFSRDGTSITIYDTPYTSSANAEVELPNLTDELWFTTDTVSYIDNIIQEVISTRLSYWNKDVLDPSEKHFVMKADDPLNFITNLPFVTVKRISQGGNSTSTTYTLDDGEKFSNWDFIISISSMYDNYQNIYNVIPQFEIQWCINERSGAEQRECFLSGGSTGGTDRRIAWGAVSDTQWVIGIRNGTSGHLPKFGGFFGVRFGRP